MFDVSAVSLWVTFACATVAVCGAALIVSAILWAIFRERTPRPVPTDWRRPR